MYDFVLKNGGPGANVRESAVPTKATIESLELLPVRSSSLDRLDTRNGVVSAAAGATRQPNLPKSQLTQRNDNDEVHQPAHIQKSML